ncbi:hypothetical protein [Rhizomonospora bruguierae]|uniref:hypothetical protein n=1 Tax=Rhizomonospora bruguierae TaxID=1581705 RepID=UPI001BD0FC96|nr:hypothetical protein [Micromonospora sp. NBRC 107566]
MSPDQLVDLAAEFAQAIGNAERFHARAATADTPEDNTAHAKAAARWEATAIRRREHLRAALREALSGAVTAMPDEALPVATWQRGRVEVRATTLDGARAVRVRYTPAQALAAGAALIACAAVTDEHSGGALTDILAAFPRNPNIRNNPANGDGKPA